MSKKMSKVFQFNTDTWVINSKNNVKENVRFCQVMTLGLLRIYAVCNTKFYQVQTITIDNRYGA